MITNSPVTSAAELDRLYQCIVDDLKRSSARCRPEDRRLKWRNENKILVARRITAYAFSRTAPRKSGPFGAVQCECSSLREG